MKRMLMLLLCFLALPFSQGACQPTSAGPMSMLTADYGDVQLPDELVSDGGNAQRRETLRQRDARLGRLYSTGEYDQCATELQGYLKSDPKDTWSWYNLACVRTRQGKNDEAMSCLVKAVDNGFCNFQRVKTDQDLCKLADREDYQKLLLRENELQRVRAQRIQRALADKVGGDYRTVIDDQCRVVFASNLSAAQLAPVQKRLHAQALAEWNELFEHPIQQYVTVIVLDPSQTDRIPAGGGGWYDDNQHSILTVQTGIILTHEFTHALHHADQLARGQTHPVWVKEGLATLFETSELRDGQLRPIHNFRLRGLQRMLAQDRTIPLREFFAMNQRGYMKDPGICYPEGRYVMMYLHEKGLLKKWYDAYTANFSRDTTGRLAMEQVCGKSIDKVDRDWRAWVRGLTYTGTLPGDRDAIGLRLMDNQLPAEPRSISRAINTVAVEAQAPVRASAFK